MMTTQRIIVLYWCDWCEFGIVCVTLVCFLHVQCMCDTRILCRHVVHVCVIQVLCLEF